MIVRLARHDGIHTVNVVCRRESVAEQERLGADAAIVSTNGPIDEQVRSIIGPQGVKYTIDPVVGETGTQMFKALHGEGRMLVDGSLTGEPIRMGEDPLYILAGRRILEVFWLGYWMPRLDEIGAAVTQAESVGRQGKVLLVPGPRVRDDDANRGTRPAARSRISHYSGKAATLG